MPFFACVRSTGGVERVTPYDVQDLRGVAAKIGAGFFVRLWLAFGQLLVPKRWPWEVLGTTLTIRCPSVYPLRGLQVSNSSLSRL